jgi:hypothetical protein
VDTDNKIQAIVEFSTSTITLETGLHDDFFTYNDLGIPLAISVNANLCTLNDEGVKIIDDTFVQLCKEMDIDPDKDYKDYDDMIDEAAK